MEYISTLMLCIEYLKDAHPIWGIVTIVIYIYKHVHCAQFSNYNIYFILSLSAVGGAVLLRKINNLYPHPQLASTSTRLCTQIPRFPQGEVHHQTQS